eukprot:TRINITY_DN17329_c0_g3_i1.p1 TRINITY_DN17329_c0_g3~~TRINITY_DN17329_c0_g3_i1.p1  ORF type:complete len:771 (-),score=145.22 TRINITY_DN17329_c0_g3_i1:833-3145(-)
MSENGVEPPQKASRNSLVANQALLGEKGTSRLVGLESKRKLSLTAWDSKFKTVSWRADAQKDYDEFTSVVLTSGGCAKFQQELLSWLIPALTGVLTACSGCFIEYCVEWYGGLRFGYCKEPFLGYQENCKDWHSWGDPSPEGTPEWLYVPSQKGYVWFIFISTLIAAISATLTWAFAPMSRGSGIPEVKTILGGFTFPEALSGNTLVIKIIGLAMSVGAGLACGKEGPLVHISCCWSNFLAKFFKRYKDNQSKQRELLSCACASGVAVAFGAPLGGVLFSYEEASTVFPIRTMLRAFVGGSVAAVTLAYLDPTGTGKLTMFNAPYESPPHWIEYPAFLVIGLVGGLVGTAFVHFNVKVSINRAPGTPFRKRCHIVLEVAAISFCTAITSYYLLSTRVLSNVAIRAFFHDCQDAALMESPTQFSPKMANTYMLDVCNPDGTPNTSSDVLLVLLLCAALRWVQMTFTFGTGAASGLFIPSLLVGAALGRIFGSWFYMLNEEIQFAPAKGSRPGPTFVNGIKPGVYAMLGAAATLGGVCRVTISLVVIMFELTGGLQLVVPFMIVCMLAKWVGDYYTIGIYDYLILVRRYPFLHEPDEVTFHTFAQDLMDESIDCLHPMCGTVGPLVKFLRTAKHGGYPLTHSLENPYLYGYVHTKDLLEHLARQLETNPFVYEHTAVVFKKVMEEESMTPKNAIDVSKFLDEGVMVVVPEYPATQLQGIFRNLGVKLVLVREGSQFVGMITKKAFIIHMEELHHSDHANTKKGGVQEALLPK